MRRAGLLGLLLVLLVTAACGGDNDNGGDQDKPKNAKDSAAALSLVNVEGASSEQPELSFPETPFSVGQTTTRLVEPGDGPVVRQGQNVAINYVMANGRDGTQAGTTFGGKTSAFLAHPSAGLAGMAKGMIGQRVGSRILIGVPPADGFGTQGNPDIGIQPDDTLVLFVHITNAHTPLAKATGTAVAAKDGLPTVKGDTKPKVTIPDTTAPTQFIAQPLIEGTGPKVKAGQTITVHYTGIIWQSKKKFDSSWDRPAPTNFVIGQSQVIPGWDKGLVGRNIGDRVLLVVPPEDGYGSGGNGPIKGTDVLVFVVDVLDAN